MELIEYTLFAMSSLFVIVDPIATIPAFLAMTPDDTPARRTQMARLACKVAAGLLLIFAVLGRWIFHFLGITIPAFQMAGSIVLLLVAIDMLRAERSRAQETVEEVAAGAAKSDIAVTPLAVPMLAGPGAISTVILLQSKASTLGQHIALMVAIVGVCVASYGIFAISSHGARWLNPIVLRLTTRIMGLLLAAVACQFFLNALRQLKVLHFDDA
jgi:multiple antibiotic resistance protein